jgi:phosphatidylglycerol lysyltransferase
MTLYDRYALVSIGRKLPWRRVTLISFISYAFSNAVGMSLLVSGSIRYRFYIQNGLTTAEVAKVVLFCTTSFWLGLLALTGVTLLCVPLPLDFPMAPLRMMAELRIPIALALTLVPLLWLAGGLLHRPLRIFRLRINMPSVSTGFRQILIGAFDWGLAAAVLYILMPTS